MGGGTLKLTRKKKSQIATNLTVKPTAKVESAPAPARGLMGLSVSPVMGVSVSTTALVYAYTA